jgi:hypothetical protein
MANHLMRGHPAPSSRAVRLNQFQSCEQCLPIDLVSEGFHTIPVDRPSLLLNNDSEG